MATEFSEDQVEPSTGDMVAHWEEQMGGETYTSLDGTLPEFKTERAAYVTQSVVVKNLRQELGREEGKLLGINRRLYSWFTNYRQTIGLLKGKDSQEYRKLPKNPRAGGKKKAAATASNAQGSAS